MSVAEGKITHPKRTGIRSNMRILYYSPAPTLALNSRSGYGTHMREMIRAFEQAGHEVIPFIVGGIEDAFNSSEEPSVGRRIKNVCRRSMPGMAWTSVKDYALLRQDRRLGDCLKKTVRRLQPDLIYERASHLQRSGIRVAKMCALPHILEVNAPVEEARAFSGARSLFEGQTDEIEKEQLSRTDRPVVVSAALRDHFIQKHGLSTDRFIVMPNAIDPNKLMCEGGRVREIVSRCDLKGRFVVGFVGSLLAWHSVDLLIRACSQLKEEARDIRVLVVGDGAKAPALKRLRDALGLDREVFFTGRVPHEEVFNFIQAMDVAAMPNSNWYGSPVKIFEYGAMGKPIIAPDNGPVREVMAPGEDGLLVEPDTGKLAEAIRTLMDNRSLRRRIARSFRNKVLLQHTWQRNAERVLEAIQASSALVV